MRSRRRAAAFVRCAGLVAIAALCVGLGPARATPPPSDSRPELMREIAEEEGLETQRDASASAYAGHVFQTLVERLFLGISDSPALRRTSRIVVWAVVLVAAALLLWVIVTLVHGAWKRRGRVRSPGRAVDRTLPPEPDPRDDFARAIEREDAVAALGALWRWVVTSLKRQLSIRPRDGATHREILELTRRRQPGWSGLTGLRELTRRSERWLYRGEPFGIDEVVALRDHLGDWLR